ncbi:Maf family protein [Devosia sp. 1566]|uniref:Maf family protein n=1 Tax=Devosia sp. 1566 TaxID=2499144 RepID=UPI000FD867EB|nr:Maf family protein [Devosia sp. 1566]
MLILASQSATRKALLAQAGLRFAAHPAVIDERLTEATILNQGGGGRAVAMALSSAKALNISLLHPGALVIGADQTLTFGGQLLHKPADRQRAAAQLRQLSGQTHQLHAAVALARGGGVVWSFVDTVELTMRGISDAEIKAVLDAEGDAVLASVGSYRLEGPSIQLFERVQGDYFSILGLPLLPLLGALRRFAPHLLLGASQS